MSNSIWRKASEKPDIDKQILIINDFGYIIYFGKCAVAPGNKWAYIDDLIAQADKAERLQKEITQELDIYYSHTPGLHPADDCIYAIEKTIGYKKPKETQ